MVLISIRFMGIKSKQYCYTMLRNSHDLLGYFLKKVLLVLPSKNHTQKLIVAAAQQTWLSKPKCGLPSKIIVLSIYTKK